MPDKIKHVVLLMFENGSFDRSLGCLQEIYPDLDGVDPRAQPRAAKDKDGNEFLQVPTKEVQMPLDPHHEHPNVMNQLRDDNRGFVRDFSMVYPDSTRDQRQLIMSYFPLGFLPGLHPLAQAFTVCDRWFSSLPGPTWPNRFFALSGSSNGLVVMPGGPVNARMIFEENQPTIFSRLTEAKRSWKVYYHDMPCSLVLHTQLCKESLANYYQFSQFVSDCAGPADKFPEFALIEPKYYGLDQNDDHPPHSVMKAQKLMVDVYNAIRASEVWDSTLLVITYDEHGGFFDHVVPPEAVPPRYPVATDEYTFDRLGVRVPAVLISPWVDRRVEHETFDHTSLLKYLCEKWQLGSLGDRVANASSVGIAIRSDGDPRRDTPERLNFDTKLLELGDRELEANPSGHHFALDVALALIKDDVGMDAVTGLADFMRTGDLSLPGVKKRLLVLGFRLLVEYSLQLFRGPGSQRDKRLRALEKTIQKAQ